MTPDITRASWIMVLALGLTWGATFMVIEIALTGITPFWLAAGRIGFAAALMLAVWLLRGGRLFLTGARNWPAMVFVGALSSAVPFMLLSWGQQFVTSGFAGVSMAAVPLMVLPLAHLLVTGERMTLRRAAGFLVGFAGVVVLIGGQAFASTGVALEPLGRAACLGAAGVLRGQFGGHAPVAGSGPDRAGHRASADRGGASCCLRRGSSKARRPPSAAGRWRCWRCWGWCRRRGPISCG